MSTVQGSLVKLYLYKSERSLIYSGTGNFKLRVGGEVTGNIDVASGTLASDIQTAILALDGFTAGDVTVSGSSTPLTIAFAGDYLFSGVQVSVEDADATATVSVAVKYPSTIQTISEANGFYLMGSETNLDKSMNVETQDVTSKDSEGWRETTSQIRSISQSPTNFYASTGNFSALREQFEKLYPVIICDITPEQYQHFGIYTMNSLSQGATFNQVVEFTAEFELTGSPTRIES